MKHLATIPIQETEDGGVMGDWANVYLSQYAIYLVTFDYDTMTARLEMISAFIVDPVAACR